MGDNESKGGQVTGATFMSSVREGHFFTIIAFYIGCQGILYQRASRSNVPRRLVLPKPPSSRSDAIDQSNGDLTVV